jgi:CRP-like cAMP-binding protein
VAEIEETAPPSTMSAGFDSRDLDEMRKIGREVSFGPGEAIFEVGDRADAMFVVLEGEADAFRSLLCEHPELGVTLLRTLVLRLREVEQRIDAWMAP